MATEAQIQANGENAKHSTGPKNTSRTRFNALKYGLLAKELIIDFGPGKENKKDFDDLLEAFRNCVNPEDAIEEALVEKMAVAHWRLRRAIRAEKGSLQLQLNDLRDFGDQIRERFLGDESHQPTNAFLRERVSKWLEDSQRLLEGKATPEELSQLREKNPGLTDQELVSKELQSVLEHIQVAEGALSDRRALIELKAALTNLSNSVPSSQETDRLLRYEITRENQFYRALNQLIEYRQRNRV